MKRPNKNDYLTTNQLEYDSKLNKYYEQLEKYCDYLEQKYSMIDVSTIDGKNEFIEINENH